MSETLTAEAIAEQFERRVYGFCLSYLRNEADARDACQEVFLTVTRKREELPNVRAVGPWVGKIALYTCMYMRRKRRRPAPLDPEADVAVSHDPLAPIDAREQLARVQEAIGRLPERYRAVLALLYQQEMPREEIALVMGLSQAGVRVLVHRAIARLREEVKR